MYMVVLLHNLGSGGLLDWTLCSTRSLAYLTIENYAIVAVNIFALISGYVASGKLIKPTRLFDLWFTAFFWSSTMALVGLAKGATPGVWTVRAFFPLLGNVYWYLSAYIVLQLFVPILDAGTRRLGAGNTLLLSAVLIVLCSLVGFTNELGIGSGYSAFWLILLWLMGRAIRMNHETIRNLISTPRLLIAVAALPLCVSWLQSHDVATGSDPSRWLSYTGPTVVIQSLCAFELMTRINLKNLRLQKALPLLSASAFGIYLADTSGWFYSIWLNGRFSWVLNIPLRYGIPYILCVSFLLFGTFLLLELLRRSLMDKLGALLSR